MRILNLLVSGDIGGIEKLCVDISKYSNNENHFWYVWSGGTTAEMVANNTNRVIIDNFTYIKTVDLYKRVIDYCKANKIEYVISHSEAPILLILCSTIKLFIPEIKAVLYIHADASFLFRKWYSKIIFRYAYGKVDGCIAISQFVKNSTEKCVDLKNKSRVVYNGIQVETYKNKSNEYVSYSDVTRLIYVGRLIYEKGLDILINAIRDFTENYTLQIVGDGPEKKELENMVSKYGLIHKVKFVGARCDIESILHESDIFIHPTRCNEGFGITIIEAMAAGVPCVTFGMGGIPEIITDNVDGFIVENVDVDNLRNSIKRVIDIKMNEPELWETICENAVERAKDFDILKYDSLLTEALQSF